MPEWNAGKSTIYVNLKFFLYFFLNKKGYINSSFFPITAFHSPGQTRFPGRLADPAGWLKKERGLWKTSNTNPVISTSWQKITRRASISDWWRTSWPITSILRKADSLKSRRVVLRTGPADPPSIPKTSCGAPLSTMRCISSFGKDTYHLKPGFRRMSLWKISVSRMECRRSEHGMFIRPSVGLPTMRPIPNQTNLL